MKKFLAILLAAIMMFSLVACTQPEDKNPPANDDGTVKYDPPSLTYLYNTSDSHKAIGEYLQAALKSAGFNMNLTNQEWNTFLETRKNGEYSVARNGWVADYNDPICFLDMWTSNSGNNDVQYGKGDHATLKMYDLDLTKWGYDVKVEDGTWAETYDVLISKIKTCTDKDTRYALMHVAEDMLMATGCIVPLYYYTDLYMISTDVKGFYSNPLGYKYFMNTTIDGQDYINVCLASEPQTLDPALNSAVDGATMLAHLFSGLAKWSQDDSGSLVIVPDIAEELVEPVANSDGTVTYTYTLKDAKWSNGDAITAADFAESWKRAASDELGADYGYMFEVVKGYGTEEGIAVKAVDDKTLEVTLANPVAYWNELLAFPTYYPVHSSNRADDKGTWATDVSTYICNGAYTMSNWEHDSIIVLTKNANYHDADSVTMNTVNCYLSDDSNNMLTNFKKGDWQLIDDVPTNEIANLKTNNADEFKIVGQIGTYYVCWNINENLLPDSGLTGVELELAQQEIRNAIALLFDRNYIVEEIAQGGQVPASSFVAMGMTDADDTEFYKNSGNSDDYDGYYDVSKDAQEANWTKAIEILSKYYNLKTEG